MLVEKLRRVGALAEKLAAAAHCKLAEANIARCRQADIDVYKRQAAPFGAVFSFSNIEKQAAERLPAIFLFCVLDGFCLAKDVDFDLAGVGQLLSLIHISMVSISS